MDKQHILVVDDNHINRLFFESSLHKLGYLVSTAESGYQALELCQAQNFNLILMDIRMIGLDGIETATKIKQIPTHTSTTILAISAEPVDCHESKVFSECLLKPISQANLQKALEQFLTPCFDDELALSISHHDQAIVAQLRDALRKALPQEWAQIEGSYKAQDKQALDDALHQLLGSAKICAASRLLAATERLKTSEFGSAEHQQAFNALHIAIKETLNSDSG